MHNRLTYLVGFGALILNSMVSDSLYAADVIADTVIVNANVYTADLNNPYAQAIAISDGDIIFVGTTEKSLSLVDDETEVIDVRGMQVLPGFIDNHNHVFEAASEVGEIVSYLQS